MAKKNLRITKRAPMNRTLTLTGEELTRHSEKLILLHRRVSYSQIENKIINQDIFNIVDFLPDSFIDLLFIDPPYNMYKHFNSTSFKEKSIEKYKDWVDSFVSKLLRCLKPNASIYFCSDWKSSTSVHLVLSQYFNVLNRITWEREKGRGAKVNWKNNSEDIWFAVNGKDYVFNYDSVRLKRRVLAPYRKENGEPKDWEMNDETPFRLTYPANIWTDISIPFWSMPENTDHPTQKPEKLLAKLILASTNNGDVIFDPFLGSGTSAVVARKLDRNFVGVEIDNLYASIAQKRLEIVDRDNSIQGFRDGIFWERNTYILNKKKGN